MKRTAKVIPAGRWPDSATENLLYWITRPPQERIAAGRELIVGIYRRVHPGRFPRMSKVGRPFQPET